MQMPKTGYELKTTYKGKKKGVIGGKTPYKGKKTAVIGGNEKEKGKK